MKKTALVVVALLVAVGGYLYWSSRPKGTDEAQIRQLLQDIQQAVKEQNPGDLASKLSADYKGVGGNKTQARLQIMQVFRETSDTSVTLNEPEITVEGSKAKVQVHVSARMTSEGGAIAEYPGDVSLELQKEPAKRYFIFPVKIWKITASTMQSRTGVETLF